MGLLKATGEGLFTSCSLRTRAALPIFPDLRYNSPMAKPDINTPKGFRDFLPVDMAERAFLLEKIKPVLEKYGFESLETPALEYADTLKGKYGEEEKLIYQFEDRGGRQVALRYDQTVPLARVIAQYPNLPKLCQLFSV